MKRRQLVIAAAALLAAPHAAGSQQARVPVVGVLAFADLTEVFKGAFRAGLRDHGYVEGKTILLEWRSAQGQAERASALAQELVRLKVDIIVATTVPAVQAVRGATTTIPIVMAPAGDPVASGLVASLARPGGNITGISGVVAELGGKLLGLIRELRPPPGRVAVMCDSPNTFGRVFLEEVQSAADRLGVRIQVVVVRNVADYDKGFTAMVKERAGAVIVQPLYADKSSADLAIRHRIPSITTGFAASAFTEAGGLMSYGSNYTEQYRHAAAYVHKILKGAKPADLPVEQTTKFDLIINLRTAKEIGIMVPPSLLARADRVIG